MSPTVIQKCNNDYVEKIGLMNAYKRMACSCKSDEPSSMYLHILSAKWTLV